ncbi:MAG: hypothetical protein ACD_54C00417G0001, partial [uncultured bacterium]
MAVNTRGNNVIHPGYKGVWGVIETALRITSSCSVVHPALMATRHWRSNGCMSHPSLASPLGGHGIAVGIIHHR